MCSGWGLRKMRQANARLALGHVLGRIPISEFLAPPGHACCSSNNSTTPWLQLGLRAIRQARKRSVGNAMCCGKEDVVDHVAECVRAKFKLALWTFSAEGISYSFSPCWIIRAARHMFDNTLAEVSRSCVNLFLA